MTDDGRPEPPQDTANWQHVWDEAEQLWVAHPTLQGLERAARAKRDELLAGSDWTQVQDSPVAAPARAAWAAYRQALRDVPQQPGFPATVIWPEAPTG